MSISFACSGCGKTMRAPVSAAGKIGKCPNCATKIKIPEPDIPDDPNDDLQLQPLAPAKPISPPIATTPPITHAPAGPATSSPVAPVRPASSPAPQASWVPASKRDEAFWLRHLHWFLALAMIPLAIHIFAAESPEETRARFGHTFEEAIDGGAEFDNETRMSDIFDSFPGNKIQGAFLSRRTYLHWVFAFASAAIYMTFFCYLATDKSAKPLHLLLIGLFTATGGVLLLLCVQTLATALPMARLRIRGLAGILLLILALIGLSYSLATDPESGWLLSFVGFTAGVGFCEEVCKAVPLICYYRTANQQTWRGAFLWGLASGAGFGVSEGVMYSSDMYNGITTSDIYFVRFISCVALHAIWSGSVGISIHQRQHLLQQEFEDFSLFSVLLSILMLVAIPMVLHGAYDTLLKKDMDIAALITAAASFGYLAWQFQTLRGDDETSDRAKFVAKFIKQRAK